jgi:thiosulfate/3-mercaptopyruvate sulfurtransferase
MFRTVWAVILLALPAAFAAQPCGGHGDSKNMVVSTAWLSAHLRDPNLVVLAIGDKSDYDRAHIPGASFLPGASLSSRVSPLTLELPPMGDLAATFSELGVGNDKRVVLYVSGGRAIQATRAYLTLDAMGLGGQTSILDGGIAAWRAEGRSVSTETPAVKRGILTPCPQNDVIVDSRYLVGNLGARGIDIVDARAPEYYSGDSTASGKRAGHIPGAVNLPFSSLTDADGKFYSPEMLREMFARAGIKPGDRVVSYCHIGLQATMVYFTARYLGHDARLYDGSWEDWSAHKEFPAETGSTRH